MIPMPLVRFPDPRSADSDGLVAIGGDLHPETVISAYRQGIFPWPSEGYPLLWFSPEERAILNFEDLHIPRSLAAARRREPFEFTIDQAFDEVIRACATTPRPGQDGTWITPEIVKAYNRLHHLGITHSVEAWREGRLVGGIYGVNVDGVFAAESMFFREPNASKLALLHLIDHLRSHDLDWLDIQVMTLHLKRLGACNIGRDRFLQQLSSTRSRGLRTFSQL